MHLRAGLAPDQPPAREPVLRSEQTTPDNLILLVLVSFRLVGYCGKAHDMPLDTVRRFPMWLVRRRLLETKADLNIARIVDDDVTNSVDVSITEAQTWLA